MMIKETSPKDLAKLIVAAAEDKKANDILVLDIGKVSTISDYFIICSANSTTQTRAIADNIEDELDKIGMNIKRKEGYREGEWVLMDYGSCVVHIFVEAERDFYNLEKLWSEAETVNLSEMNENK